MSQYIFPEKAYEKIELDEKLISDINSPDSLKLIASVSREGEIHAVFKGSLHVNDDGQLEFYEIMESSQNNKNMVWSVWNDKKVAVTILTKDHRSYEIQGVVHRGVVAGAEFEEAYRKVTDSGRYDLSTIWKIDPVSVREETYSVREKEAKEDHPHFRHLDQLVV